MKDDFLTDSQAREMVKAATRAASVLNTQPWLFEISHDQIDVFADPTRQVASIDPDGPQLVMSCGAALLNLRLAMLSAGWEALVEVLPDPADPLHIGRVARGRARVPDPTETKLFSAIPARRTNRRPFSPEPPTAGAVTALLDAATLEAVDARVLDGLKGLAVADLVVSANRALGADPAVRADIARWTAADPGAVDGIPVEALGPVAHDERTMVRDFGFGADAEVRGESDFETNPLLLLLSTVGDQRSDWVAAGQAMQRLQLVATTVGVATSFLGQPFDAGLRAALETTSVRAGTPQMLLRVGYGPTSPTTPRRPVPDVIRQRSSSHRRTVGTVEA